MRSPISPHITRRDAGYRSNGTRPTQVFTRFLRVTGCPWGTFEEQDIPGPLVFEAEFALAREQLKTQTPGYEPMPAPVSPGQPRTRPPRGRRARQPHHRTPSIRLPPPLPPMPLPRPPPTPRLSPTETSHLAQRRVGPIRGALFHRRPAAAARFAGPAMPPVLRHTRIYNGHDTDFTTALESYYNFRDDARFDGWQGYLQRSDDFIRFCCHMHIWEMLTARGGAGETRVVWRWPVR